MKNLKKVLALVLACVMVFGTVTMAAGTGYPDVAEDAAYAEAVKTLSALNIIKGDENGNFNPDATITRAEMAKILCTMLNTGDLATTTTIFADVPAAHWASGYIAYAQQLGYIDGYGDGNFGPEDPVTYNQVLKLVMATLGYTYMANEFGGYPTGYLYVAANAEVTKGAAGSGDEAAARSTVAIIVNNAMNTPLMERTTYGTESLWSILDGGIGSGNVQREFKTLLTKQKIYLVEGYVSDTYLQDTSMKDGFIDVVITKNLKIDVVDKLGAIGAGPWNKANVDATLAGDDATDYIDYTASIYFKEAANGDIVVIRVAPKSTKNVMIEIADLENVYNVTKDSGVRANDKPSIVGANVAYSPAPTGAPDATIAATLANVSSYVLSFWNDRDADARITTVDIAADATVRINDGSAFGLTAALEAEAEYYAQTTGNAPAEDVLLTDLLLTANRKGSMNLVDQDGDGKYDIIEVTNYEVAIVDSTNTATNRINFKPERTGAKGYIVLSNEGTNKNFKQYSITLDGEAIDVADLKEYDVLNVTTNDWNDPVYYDITVTRSVIEGKVTQLNNIKGYVVVDGEKYEAITAMTALPKLGDEGKFYLDAKGKIVKMVKTSSVAGNYAYLYNIGAGSFSETYVGMFTKDGESVRYELAEKITINGVQTTLDTALTDADIVAMYGVEPSTTPAATAVAWDDVLAYVGPTTTPATAPLTARDLIVKIAEGDYAFGGSGVAYGGATLNTAALTVSGVNTIDKFVTYKIDNSNKITAIDFAFSTAKDEFTYNGAASQAEWKASLARFAGTQDITSDAILFFIETGAGKTIEDYSVKTVADLVDETKYDIHFFSLTEEGSAAAIVLNAASDIDTSSALNIFAGYTKGKIGFDDVYYVTYWKNGVLAAEPMVAQGDESIVTSMNIGDAFICKYDKDGRADAIATVFVPGAVQPTPNVANAFAGMVNVFDGTNYENFKWYNEKFDGVDGAGDDSALSAANELKYNNADNEFFFGYVGKVVSTDNGIRATLLGESGSFQLYADPNEYAVINIPSTAKVTVYNAAMSDSFKLAEGTLSDITASYFTKTASGNMDLTDTTTYTDYSYALVRVYKDVVTEVIFVRYSR